MGLAYSVTCHRERDFEVVWTPPAFSVRDSTRGACWAPAGGLPPTNAAGTVAGAAQDRYSSSARSSRSGSMTPSWSRSKSRTPHSRFRDSSHSRSRSRTRPRSGSGTPSYPSYSKGRTRSRSYSRSYSRDDIRESGSYSPHPKDP